MNGSSNSVGLGARLALLVSDGMVVEYALCFDFLTINNEAEYKALIAGLQMAKELGAQDLRVCSDSQLMVRYVRGNYEAWKKKCSQVSPKGKGPHPNL